MTLRDLAGSRWTGRYELWLDETQNTAETGDCSIAVGAEAIEYRWQRADKEHVGTLALRAGGADFTDTFHSQSAMACTQVADSWALVDVLGTYSYGGSPPWGWRITVSRRPESDELVVQMTNICPWGEDGRAVRMIARRA